MRPLARLLRQPVLLVLLAWVATQLCLVLSGPMAVRLLGVEGRGQVALAFAVVLLCSQVGLLGLPAALTYFGSDGSVPVWRLLGSIRSAVAAQVAVTTTVAAIVLVLLSRVGDVSPPSAEQVVVVAVGAGAVVLARLFITGLQAEHRLAAFAVVQPLPALLYAVALAGLLWLGVESVDHALALYVAGWVVCLVLAARLLRTDRLDRPGADTRPEPREVLRFGRRAAVASASPTDQFGVDQLIVGAVLGHLALGFYAIGLAFESVTLLPLLFLGTFVGPRIARLPHDERAAAARGWLWAGLGLGVLTCAVVQVLIPFVLPLAFGEEARDAVPVAHLLALAGTFLGQRTLNNTALQAMGAPGATTRVEAVAFVVMLVGVLALGSRWGALGAAGGLLAAAVCANLLQLRVLRQVRDRGPVAAPDGRVTVS